MNQSDQLSLASRIVSDALLLKKAIEAQKEPAPPEGLAALPPYYMTARGELGVKETRGPEATKRITEYLHSTRLPDRMADSDETPWCSGFVNWCVKRAGLEGTNKANARSWMDWGVPLDAPRPGCVVVLWRGDRNGAKGHVAFYEGSDGGNILLLGGNQANSVSVRPYPRSRLLGYRWHEGT